MEHYLKILLLAVIQGAAELLPVSSSAHVIVAERLMGMEDPSSPNMVFLLVMLHTGTMFAVLVYFWPRWRAIWREASAPGESTSSRHHFLKMVIWATIITGVIGGVILFLEKRILQRFLGPEAKLEDLFKNLPLIATSLFVVGIIILIAGLLSRKEQARPLTGWSAAWIGLLQGVCLPFRGFSRSGATISLALLLGIPRQRAEDFSFALAVGVTPAVIGYSLYKLLKAGSTIPLFDQMLPGLTGMAFSFLAGLLALKLLSAVLEKGQWHYFGYYCLLAALLMAAGIVSGVLTAPGKAGSEAAQVGVVNSATSPPATTLSGSDL
jgi:undecaprenyl-diphosphatase